MVKSNGPKTSGHFWAKYIIILFKNRFNSFIYFSASDWHNKNPISLFEKSKSPNSTISGFWKGAVCFTEPPGEPYVLYWHRVPWVGSVEHIGFPGSAR